MDRLDVDESRRETGRKNDRGTARRCEKGERGMRKGIEMNSEPAELELK